MIHSEEELLLLFGQPGSGKSTLVNHLLRYAKPREVRVGAAFITEWSVERFASGSLVELGRRDNGTGFRGSDRLTMNAITYLKPWLVEHYPPLVLAEGDRFANLPFIEWASQFWNVLPVYLNTPDEVCAQRRHARFVENGANWKFTTRKTTGPPNEQWVAGRVTKARNLASALPNVLTLQGAADPEVQEQQLLFHNSRVAHWLWVRRLVDA